MHRTEPIADARDLVAELFPQARLAFLSGSIINSSRTTGSDLDVVVLLPDGDPLAPCRQSQHFRTWPVELFVYDEESLEHYFTKELANRRPVLTRMIATGVQLTGDTSHANQLQTRCAKTLAAGPAPLTDNERANLRYKLTDLLDDLTHATDPGERTVIASTGWTTAAEQSLAINQRWTGTGKWLLRELRDLDPTLADRWLTAHPDPTAIANLIQDTLTQTGGPLFAGYRVKGDRQPTNHHP